MRARYNTGTVHHPTRVVVSGGLHVRMIVKVVVVWPNDSRVVINHITWRALLFGKRRSTMAEPEHIPIIPVWRRSACRVGNVLGTGGYVLELIFEVD